MVFNHNLEPKKDFFKKIYCVVAKSLIKVIILINRILQWNKRSVILALTTNLFSDRKINPF